MRRLEQARASIRNALLNTVEDVPFLVGDFVLAFQHTVVLARMLSLGFSMFIKSYRSITVEFLLIIVSFVELGSLHSSCKKKSLFSTVGDPVSQIDGIQRGFKNRNCRF